MTRTLEKTIRSSNRTRREKTVPTVQLAGDYVSSIDVKGSPVNVVGGLRVT